MNNRAQEVALQLKLIFQKNATDLAKAENDAYQFVMALEEFSGKKWIKCMERMPEIGQKVFWCYGDGSINETGECFADTKPMPEIYWQPRYVPKPVESKSDLVKELENKRDKCLTRNPSLIDSAYCAYVEAIEIVKRHEKGS